jgi:predicted RNase H-like HicB family nuclease/DNA-binding XRE family transcriptional regulator
MILEGKIWKHEKHWLIAVPALDVMTQGRTRKQARSMLKDAIELLINQKDFQITISPFQENDFFIFSDNDTDLLALMLKRQRAKYQLSLSDMAEKLHMNSKNAYAQYEQGRNQPSLSKIEEFFTAMDSKLRLSLKVIKI